MAAFFLKRQESGHPIARSIFSPVTWRRGHFSENNPLTPTIGQSADHWIGAWLGLDSLAH